MAKRLILGLLLLLLSGITIAIEELKYRVIEVLGILGLGVYNPKILAGVEVSGTLKQASSKGFRLIADYIFGNNSSRSVSGGNQEVSMTAPVTIQ